MFSSVIKKTRINIPFNKNKKNSFLGVGDMAVERLPRTTQYRSSIPVANSVFFSFFFSYNLSPKSSIQCPYETCSSQMTP